MRVQPLPAPPPFRTNQPDRPASLSFSTTVFVRRGAGEPEVRTNVQAFEHRGFQSRTLSDSATGPNAFYLHPEVGLAHRSTGLKNETGLCQMGATARAGETGAVSGDVLGSTGAIVQELAAADGSVRGASIDHWQGSSGTGRFGQRAAYEALRTSTLY